jgi:tetratricopeptide (TPR) repeat protein
VLPRWHSTSTPRALVSGGLAVGVIFAAFHLAALGSPPQDATTAQEHAARGRQLAQSGVLKGAEAELRRAVELAPRDAPTLSALGAILGMQQRLAESNVYLERALAIDPADFAARRNLGSNQFQLGQLEPAKENLERAFRQMPADQTATLLLGMVEEELQHYVRAVDLFTSVPDQVRKQPQSIVALARAYYRTGQPDKARAALQELEGHPAGPEGSFLGGQVASQADDLATAERMFASVLATHPDRAKVGFNLALVQYRNNRIEECRATLETLLRSGQLTSDVFNLLAWCYHKEGNLKEAIKAMDLAIDREPSRESNYLDLAMILTEHRRYSVALAAAKKALEAAPDSYQAYRWKGFIEAKLHYSLEAIKSYSRAVEIKPDAAEALLGLAVAQMSEGKLQDAQATFQKGIERFPRDALLHQEYGRMLVLWEDRDAASQARGVSLLRAALALDSTLAEPHFQLGKLAMRDGDTQGALGHLQAAEKLSPRNKSVHYSLAGLYRRLGRSEEAAKELREFESLKEDQDEAVPGVRAQEARPSAIKGASDMKSPALR